MAQELEVHLHLEKKMRSSWMIAKQHARPQQFMLQRCLLVRVLRSWLGTSRRMNHTELEDHAGAGRGVSNQHRLEEVLVVGLDSSYCGPKGTLGSLYVYAYYVRRGQFSPVVLCPGSADTWCRESLVQSCMCIDVVARWMSTCGAQK